MILMDNLTGSGNTEEIGLGACGWGIISIRLIEVGQPILLDVGGATPLAGVPGLHKKET